MLRKFIRIQAYSSLKERKSTIHIGSKNYFFESKKKSIQIIFSWNREIVVG